MRALLQRVSRGEVRIDGQPVASIGPGLLILLGVGPTDDETVAIGLAAKIAGLRIFADEPVLGERLYQVFCEALAAAGISVARGRFGAEMAVELVNEGPFTIWLDSDELGLRPKSAT
jgi:D-tyrosyl-tRNA(Tyr) deacylase